MLSTNFPWHPQDSHHAMMKCLPRGPWESRVWSFFVSTVHLNDLSSSFLAGTDHVLHEQTLTFCVVYCRGPRSITGQSPARGIERTIPSTPMARFTSYFVKPTDFEVSGGVFARRQMAVGTAVPSDRTKLAHAMVLTFFGKVRPIALQTRMPLLALHRQTTQW